LLTYFCLDILILPFTPTKYFIPTMTHKLIFPFWPVTTPLLYFSTIQFTILCPIAFFYLKIS
jgi:hypothetical protein